jgi:uncharacterized protein (DUF362 family)
MAISRRTFITGCLGGAVLAASGYSWWRLSRKRLWRERTLIARVKDYHADLAAVIFAGLKELGVTSAAVAGKRVLLKPNLVETAVGKPQINTHPAVVRGAVEAFLKLGAGQVVVAEGPGHIHDTTLVLEESGLAEALVEDRIPFVDLNYDNGIIVPNAGGWSKLPHLTLPVTLLEADYIVSLAKLKTHHWAGVTLSMKNLFGVMPGIYYGWPKNVLHWAGIPQCILDLTASIKPHFAIVDGIIGMEGDGPIMGTPKAAGVLVMGSNLTAVDATCTRLMGIDPFKVSYLAAADGRLGPVAEEAIVQVGEPLAQVRTPFQLLDFIPAQRQLRS